MGVLAWATDPIPLTVSPGEVVRVPHGLNRQVAGWLVVWATAPVVLSAPFPGADTRAYLDLQVHRLDGGAGPVQVRLALL